MIEEPAVVIIAFRRPALTRQILQKVELIKPKRLYIVADGPRESEPSDDELVRLTRSLFEELSWECDVTRIYSETNLGLRNRVLSGLDEVFESAESAIILEDDCLPSDDFFAFTRELLGLYEQDSRVGLVSGNNFAPSSANKASYYFSTHANIWGWATWRRTWERFRSSNEVSQLSPDEVEKIKRSISGRGQRRQFLKLLALSKNLDSWAIQFASFIYLNDLLSAVPNQNLVTNIGFGRDSTHTKFESWADEMPLGKLEFPLTHPTSVAPDIIQMRRESRRKSMRWVVYPLRHPVDALNRILRYITTLS